MNTSTGTDLHQVLDVGLRKLNADMPGDWVQALRTQSAEQVSSMALPTRKDEAWRYTSLKFLEELAFVPVDKEPFSALQLEDIDELLLTGNDGTRLVFVNGFLAPQLSRLEADRPGVLVTNLASAFELDKPAIQSEFDRIAQTRNMFTALNGALMTDGACVVIDQDTAVDAPIELLHISIGTDDPSICHPRHLIVLQQGARAEVIERYASLGNASYFNNALIEVALGENSELIHERVQEESLNAQHLSDLQIRQAAGSRYRLANASLGAAWSRCDVRLVFDGEGADAQLDGLLMAGDGQLADTHLDIQHAVPHCSSRETFKGILDGKGRVVFDGRILVAKDAQKTDAQLSNDNLMLSRSAEVDTKPQLEIYADDVKCSHGTTVGELDGNMLFYLRSRGIPERQATQMLCLGFAEEILAAMPAEALRARSASLLASRLGGGA